MTRSIEQKTECLRKAILNSREHISAGDPKRIYSQYMRYALDQFKDINAFISGEAMDMRRNETIDDHVIPHTIVMEKMISLNSLDSECIKNSVGKYFALCRISRRENMLLNEAGLKSRMPNGWDDRAADMFARYYAVGILKIHRK